MQFKRNVIDLGDNLFRYRTVFWSDNEPCNRTTQKHLYDWMAANFTLLEMDGQPPQRVEIFHNGTFWQIICTSEVQK